MTLRDFIKSTKGASKKVLDSPMQIYFEVYDKDGNSTVYTPQVVGAGTYSEDCFIGPDGTFGETELNKLADDGEADLEEYDLFMKKDRVFFQIEDMNKPETPKLDSILPWPFMKAIKE